MAVRSFQVTFDAADPAALSGFWAEALDYREEPPPPGFDDWEAFAAAQDIPPEDLDKYRALVDPEGRGPRLFFQRVPEAKTAKNRMHLDINVAPRGATEEERRSSVAAVVSRLVDLGASVQRSFEEHGSYWIVMQDPEGNEFCVQ
jgi:hypothetical protein